MIIKDFIEHTKKDRVTLGEFVKNLHTYKHEFSLPVLVDYHRVGEYLKKKRILFLKGAILFAPLKKNAPYKVFIYDECGIKYIPFLPKEVRLLTFRKVEGVKTHQVRTEIVTLIDKMFEEKSYSSHKKYMNEVVYPLRKLDKIDFVLRDIYKEDLPIVRDVIKQWIDYKINVEKVFRLVFTPGRYIRVIENSFDKDILLKFDKYNKIAFVDGKPYGVFSMGLDKSLKHAYDLTSVTLRWKFDKSSSSFNNMNSAISLKLCSDLLENHQVKYLNRGFTMDKGLHHFKTKYPYKEQKIYCSIL